jgi:large subunit ribosomal protein L23
MNQERLLKIILAHHMSEKAVTAMEKTKTYVFEVLADATKPEIQQAIEAHFNTKVEHVRIVNVKTKPKRFGRTEGRSKAWKKAYVKLQPGNEISFAGGQ